MKLPYLALRIAAFAALLTLCLTGQTRKYAYSPREKAFYANPQLVDFVRPGLAIAINSATISSAGIISVVYTLTDPSGLPLDAAGVNTPGAVSLAYVASYIPKGQEQYVAYTTAAATGARLGTITRPDFELGGTATLIGPGQYQYTFIAQAPAGFDPTVTTTVAVDGNRDLTSFNLGTNYAGTTFDFVPNGAAVAVTRDVIRTASCNACHVQLAFHGGYAQGMNMCVLCHQPQNQDPTTGNSLDLKVMAHQIHMGAQLFSVVGTATTPGVPYQIAGYGGFLTNFSKVIDPADPRRCEVCHSQTTGAAQAAAFMTKPTAAACGSCHNDVNLATGFSTGSEPNHAGGPQPDDTQCAQCHVPTGKPFDASVLGSHVVPTDTPASYPLNPDTYLAGINLAITGVTNTSAGQTPIVNFTLKDNSGNNLAISSTTTVSFTMSGPNTDYGATNFGANATTPGYVTESVTAALATCSAGACSYPFTHAIPAGSTGSYAIGGEARTTVTVLAGTTLAQSVELGAINPVVNFSVDGSAVAPRRTVVSLANCNTCHVQLSLHGGLRNNTAYCVLCHNPSNTDFTTRPTATVVADQTQPAQGINFNLMVHRLHDGVNAASNPQGPPKYPYVVVGHGGSVSDFSGTLFPVMSPAGAATYMQDCAVCHVNGSEQNNLTLTGLNPVTDPQGWVTPNQPFSSACSGCHASKVEASHFLSNTDSLGESCAVCHAAGAQFAVSAVHAQ